MKFVKRTLALTLALVMTLALGTTALAAVSDTGFSDVSAGAWYADAVSYVKEQNLMSGTSGTTFSPELTTSRAMLATILHRAEGSPTTAASAAFTDVTATTWYADAAAWASSNGVMSGYNDGRFGGDDPVTREQIATILWRYAGSPSTENGTDFADEASISGYASVAVDWARANGIINGKSGNLFDPQGNATRAQVATMLRNYFTQEQSEVELPSESNRILIAYFSRAGENYGVGTVTKGNTQIVAEMIGEETDSTLFQIQTVTPYPTNYEECTQVAQEEQRTNARPALAGSIADFDQYDTIFLGYPIWWGDMPMAVYTFLESYDFSGKTVIPFSTNAGTGISGTVQTLTNKLTTASVLNGFAIAGTTAQNDQTATRTAVNQWLAGLNLPKKTTQNSTTKITMTVGSTVVTAELSDSQTTRDFLALQPQTVTLNQYGDREYYGNPGGTLSTSGEAIADFENGDVTFYPPSGNLAIFFGNEDTSNQSGLIRMGKITSNLSVFDTVDDRITMQISRAG